MRSIGLEPVTVVIPAFNEESVIGTVVRQISDIFTGASIPYEIIVVDDGSSDATAEKAGGSDAIVLRHKRNRGYGAALKTGIRHASHDVIVIVDADGTYPIDKLPAMLQEMDHADMVVGARVGRHVAVPWIRRPAKWVLKKFAEYVSGEGIPDLNSGLRIFRRQCVQQYLGILPDQFSFTTTITVAMTCDGYRIHYLPIDYHQRVGKSKIVAWDFVNFMQLVTRLSMFFDPMKVFFPIAFFLLGLGMLKILIDLVVSARKYGGFFEAVFSMPTISTSAIFLLISGLQIFLVGMMADGITKRISQRLPHGYAEDHPAVKRPPVKQHREQETGGTE